MTVFTPLWPILLDIQVLKYTFLLETKFSHLEKKIKYLLLLLFKGIWSTRKQLFYRILLGSWCLAALVLVNAYSSLLISYLTIPKLMPAPKNYDDLAFNDYHKNNLRSIADKNSLTIDMMSVGCILYIKVFVFIYSFLI